MTPSVAQGERADTIPAVVWIAVALAVAAGIALRLTYPFDIEYKADEQFSFETARAMLSGDYWSWGGMPMSVGGANPGMSLWIFAGLMFGIGADTPPELARAVQLLNCAGLIALVLFAARVPPPSEREPWLWAAALWAVNPIAIILERKIWPPSVLPLFIVMLIAAWWHRRAALGSFAFGLLAALLSQIHMSVLLYAAMLVAWACFDDRRSWRWGALIGGIVIGVLPAVPWLFELLSNLHQIGSGAGVGDKWRRPVFSIWLWFATQPFGFGIDYTLWREHFRDLLSGPSIGGSPSYFVWALQSVLGVLAAWIYLRAGRTLWKTGWPSARSVLLGHDTTGLLLRATVIGQCLLLTLLTVRAIGPHRHYLISLAPVMALFIARVVSLGDTSGSRRAGRALLYSVTVAVALMSALLLQYIHVTQVIRGEYGPDRKSVV